MPILLSTPLHWFSLLAFGAILLVHFWRINILYTLPMILSKCRNTTELRDLTDPVSVCTPILNDTGVAILAHEHVETPSLEGGVLFPFENLQVSTRPSSVLFAVDHRKQVR